MILLLFSELAVERKKRDGKSFGKFNFIVFLMLNVFWGVCHVVGAFFFLSKMKRVRMIRRMREKCDRKTVSARGGGGHQAPHTVKCVYKSLRFATKLNFILSTEYIDRNEGLNFFHSPKYCTIRVVNLYSG
jgi:hypothetical protein